MKLLGITQIGISLGSSMHDVGENHVMCTNVNPILKVTLVELKRS